MTPDKCPHQAPYGVDCPYCENAALKAEVERLISCWTEIDRVKAEVNRLQSYLQMDANELAAQRDRYKALAEKMAEALKCENDRCDHAAEALALFDAELRKA